MLGVIYARYSEGPNQTDRSIEGQVSDCIAYAAENDIQIVDTYADRSKTGTNDNRDAFQRMLKDSSKKLFDCVIVWKIDRFGRNREEIAINKVKLKKNSVALYYAKEHIPEGPEGIILESMLEGMAEYYSANLSQNVKRGIRVAAEHCRATNGSLGFGFKKGPNKEYLIDENRAPIVREIFARYAGGESIAMIIDDLNAREIRTATGGPFNKNSIRVMLQNEKYIGIYHCGNVRIPGGVPAIVDPDTYQIALARFLAAKHNKQPRRKLDRSRFFLTGKMYCAECGSGLIGESGKSKTGVMHYYYNCAGKRKKTADCSGLRIKKDVIEKMVFDLTMSVVLDDKIIGMIADKIMEIQEQNNNNARISALKNEKKEAQKKIDNIMTAIEQGILTPTTKDRLMQLEEQKASLEYAIETEKIKGAPISRDMVLFFLHQFRKAKINDELSFMSLIDAFIGRIDLSPEKITITYNYCDKNKKTCADLDKPGQNRVRLSSKWCG